MSSYKIKVNNQYEFEVSSGKGEFIVDNEALELDIARINEGTFHVIADHISYNVELLNIQPKEKKLTISVDGNDYDLVLKDKFDLLLQKLGMERGLSAKVKELKAPMPGKVLQINVKEGDEVQKGDQIIVLEAMKMENAIKSPGEGKVKSVKVKEEEPVEKGQVLVEFE